MSCVVSFVQFSDFYIVMKILQRLYYLTLLWSVDLNCLVRFSSEIHHNMMWLSQTFAASSSCFVLEVMTGL